MASSERERDTRNLRLDPKLKHANRLSGEATAAKIAFVKAYNPIAARFFPYKNNWTERDF